MSSADHIFTEDHSVIEREYLNLLLQIKTDVSNAGLDSVAADAELMQLREYARARIPREYWQLDTPLTLPRAILPTVTKYVLLDSKSIKS